MAQLQIVSGSEIETPASAVHINAQPFREAALMKGRVGAAVGDSVSGFFGEVSKKFQDNVNARTVLDADLKMRKFSDDFRDSLAKNPDENTWLPDLNEKSTQLREDILSGPHVGPDVKQHLTAMIDQWQQAQSSEVKTAAQIRSINRTKATVIEDYTKASRDGDEQGALAAIDLGVQNHALFPEDADRMRKELPAITQTAKVETGIQNQPYQTLKLLEDQDKSGKSKAFPALNPQQLGVKIREARTATNKWQTDNAMDLYDNPPTDDILKQKVESGEISEPSERKIKAYRDKTNYESARASTGELRGDISDYDPSKDKDSKEYNQLKESIRAIPDFMAAKRDKLKKLLDDKKAMKGSSHGDTVINRMYSEKLFGDPTADRASWKKANDQREELQNDFEQWHTQNPGASNKEQYDYVWNRTKTNRGKSIVGTTDQFGTQ